MMKSYGNLYFLVTFILYFQSTFSSSNPSPSGLTPRSSISSQPYEIPSPVSTLTLSATSSLNSTASATKPVELIANADDENQILALDLKESNDFNEDSIFKLDLKEITKFITPNSTFNMTACVKYLCEVNQKWAIYHNLPECQLEYSAKVFLSLAQKTKELDICGLTIE